MNPYLRNVLRGVGCGAIICVFLVLFSWGFHQFVSLWVAIVLTVLPYVATFVPSVYTLLVEEPLKVLAPTRSGVGMLRRWLVLSFVLGYFLALIACMYFFAMAEITL